jgi:hypothetical protein
MDVPVSAGHLDALRDFITDINTSYPFTNVNVRDAENSTYDRQHVVV